MKLLTKEEREEIRNCANNVIDAQESEGALYDYTGQRGLNQVILDILNLIDALEAKLEKDKEAKEDEKPDMQFAFQIGEANGYIDCCDEIIQWLKQPKGE